MRFRKEVEHSAMFLTGHLLVHTSCYGDNNWKLRVKY